MIVGTLTYMIDLDGTLTTLNDEDFAREYIRLLMKYNDGFLEEEFLKNALFSSLNCLLDDAEGKKSNFDRYMDSFAKISGLDNKEEVMNFFLNFYGTTYNEMKKIIIPRKDVIEFLDYLENRKHRLVLATNPIFPEIAIKKRLEWIGADPEKFEYITTMENSHYVKPQIDYYNEILKKTNSKAEKTLMIGNDDEMDGACEKAGIRFIDISFLRESL
ncbi:MAG: HAD hydrolase-like protein [Kosmotoga sp.]|nr:MAG: HAD hydrolase-like protein [Kosmotoga sp.]